LALDLLPLTNYSAALRAAARAAISRPLRRAALRGCKIPLRAALSSLLAAWRSDSSASSNSLLAMSVRVFLTEVRAEERATRLRSRRLAELRIRFLADAVLANCAFLHHYFKITRKPKVQLFAPTMLRVPQRKAEPL
jgi:hypothetical protein